jgi:uncharacterized protein YndB with AHSA1/START domain
MSEEGRGHEVRREIYIDASPATVFALLTSVQLMTKWLAETVEADPVSGGIFRIAEAGGMSIEGHYVEVIKGQKVVFTWGGIEGLKPGESTVEFILEPQGKGTLVKLRHYGLPEASIDSHDLGWLHSGLPKLKAAAEGREPGGLCLGDLAHAHRHG